MKTLASIPFFFNINLIFWERERKRKREMKGRTTLYNSANNVGIKKNAALAERGEKGRVTLHVLGIILTNKWVRRWGTHSYIFIFIIYINHLSEIYSFSFQELYVYFLKKKKLNKRKLDTPSHVDTFDLCTWEYIILIWLREPTVILCVIGTLNFFLINFNDYIM